MRRGPDPEPHSNRPSVIAAIDGLDYLTVGNNLIQKQEGNGKA